MENTPGVRILIGVFLFAKVIGVPFAQGQAIRITDGPVFNKVILPILQEKCMKCHGPDKAKGKLRLHSQEHVKTADGLIEPGNLEESELIYRITLPLNDPDDEKMPPSDQRNQLTADEIWLIKWWVFKGASYDTKLSEIKNTEEARPPLLRTLRHYAIFPPGTTALVPKEPEPEPVTSPSPPAASVTAKSSGPRKWGSIYEEVVDPILEHNCGKCHGEGNAEAKLRLHTPEAIKAGGKNAPVLIAGNPSGSLLMQRIHLPAGDDDRMPPAKENRQLSPHEINILKWWIQSGARFDQPLGSAPGSLVPVMKQIIAAADARKSAPRPGATGPKVAAAEGGVLKAVRDFGVNVVEMTKGSNALAVHCDDMAVEVNDAALRLIARIGPQVVWLNLAKTRVSDAGLATLAQFPELRRLHLDRTGIADAGLAHVAKLTKLEYLNLYKTKVSDAGLRQLTNMPTLKKIYAGQTRVTEAGAAQLMASNPDLEINDGFISIPTETPQPGAIGTIVGPGQNMAAGPQVDPTPVNTMCPIKPDRRIDPTRTTVFKGKTIGLCCGRCLAIFNDNPSAYISKVVITRQPRNMAAKPATPAAPSMVSFGPRTWTKASGGSVQGSLFAVNGPTAVINITGVNYQVPIDSLSAADKQYIQKWKTAKGI